MAALTLVALGGIAIVGWRGYRQHSFGEAELSHNEDTPEDRHRFLGFTMLLLAALSGVAVLYSALVAVFIKRCW
jgi:hypothetical protein